MGTKPTKSGVARPLIVAAGVGIVMLAAGGIGHRVLSRHLDLAVGGEPIPRGTLAKLPLALGEWTGREQEMDKRIAERIGCDDWISRMYVRGATTDAVGLFVSAGIRSRDLSPHRPEVCYPTHGWTLRDANDAILSLDGESELPYRIFHFSRTGLTAEKTTVLNYFIVDGQCCPDVELLRSKSWRGSKGVRYVARVMITANDRQFPSQKQADRAVKKLAAVSAKGILALLPEVKQEPASAAANGAGQGHAEGRTP